MNTMEKAFDAYKKEVAKYARLVHEVRKKHGTKSVDPLTLDSSDYHNLEQGTATLRALEKVLGLSPDEVAEVEKANGLFNPGTPAPAKQSRRRPPKPKA